MGRGWQLSCTSVSMPLSQPSPLGKSTCPNLAQLQRSSSTARSLSLFLFWSPTVCIWSDCDSHLKRTEVWFCLPGSNASQMDPITCLIVATSCPPFFFPQATHCTLALQAQMRQSYKHCWPSLYIQGLLTGGCCCFCLAVKSNEPVCCLCRLRPCKKRQCIEITFEFFSSHVGLSSWHFVAILSYNVFMFIAGTVIHK